METAEVLKKYNINPNPDADQHFMTDEKMLKKIVSAAMIKPDDVVLEIGAGIGNLTKLLAKKAQKVYAIEKDGVLIGALKSETEKFRNVEIISGDALKIMLPEFDRVVSNLPYQICEALLQKMTLLKFRLAVVCIPEKFAEKILAKKDEKSFSVLSIKAQAFFDIKPIASVPRECFMPVPGVDSRIARIAPKKRLKFCDFAVQEFFRESDKVAKNAIREALIFASKQGRTEKLLTKRSAKKIVEKIKMAPLILEKRVFSLNEMEISSVIEHMKRSRSNY